MYTAYAFVISCQILDLRANFLLDTGGDLFDIAAKLGEPGYDREQQAKRA